MTIKEFKENALTLLEAIQKYGEISTSKGVNNQKTLFWVKVTLNDVIKEALKKDYLDKGYYAINLTPYYVDQHCWENIKRLNHFDTKKYELPNIDETTGNLHPKWTDQDNEEWLKKPVFKQAVLITLITPKKSGPKYKGCKIKENENDITKALEYCNCYYPPVDGSVEFGKSSAEDLIKGLLKRVLDPESEVYASVFGTGSEE